MKHAESPIEQKTCRLAKDRGVLNFKLSSQYETGLPDRMFLIPGGKPLFIEFKRPGETPTPKQLWWHDLLRKLGYNIEVHDDAARALQAITNAVEAARLPKEGDEVPS